MEPASHKGDPDGIPALGFALAQVWLLAFGESTSKGRITLFFPNKNKNEWVKMEGKEQGRLFGLAVKKAVKMPTSTYAVYVF